MDIKDDIVPTPPSSLDLDRLKVRSSRHVRGLDAEVNPTVSGGDADADFGSAYSVGDEAPGGDNPTPDQDIVDDVGRAVGLEYQDTEELGSEGKLESRDRKRWELDPASSEDYRERE